MNTYVNAVVDVAVVNVGVNTDIEADNLDVNLPNTDVINNISYQIKKWTMSYNMFIWHVLECVSL